MLNTELPRTMKTAILPITRIVATVQITLRYSTYLKFGRSKSSIIVSRFSGLTRSRMSNIRRVRNSAANKVAPIPRHSVTANPLIAPVPKYIRIKPTNSVVKFESRITVKARL